MGQGAMMLNETYTPPWMSSEQKTGFIGEVWVSEQLQRRGYAVRMIPDWQAKSCDLVINGILPVEVKTSTQRQRKYVTASGVVRHYPWFQANVSNFDFSDRLVIFVAIDLFQKNYPYIIPGAIAAQKTTITLSSHPTKYGGQWSPFLNNWQMVDYFLNQRYRNAGQLDFEAVQ